MKSTSLTEPLGVEQRLQDVGIFLVALAGTKLSFWRELELSSLPRIEQGSKDAGRVEPWKTAPVNRAIHADQRGRVHVAYHPVVAYRPIVPYQFPIEACGYG